MLIFRNEKNRTILLRQVARGNLVSLAPGIFSNDTVTEPGAQIRANVVKVIEFLRPGSTISHASALLPDMGASEGVVIVTDPAMKNDPYLHELPGLKLLSTPGLPALPSDTSISANLHISSRGRAILENLEDNRINKKLGRPKQLPLDRLESVILKLAPHQEDVDGLDAVVTLSNKESHGHWDIEVQRFRDLQQSVQSTQNRSSPLHRSSDVDWARIESLEKFSIEIKRGIHGNQRYHEGGLPKFPNHPSHTDNRFHNLSFFESYFSNYIEGTEFEPDEAYEIATSINPNIYEAKDGHDIRALFELYSKPEDFLRPDKSAQDYLKNLKVWHEVFGNHADKKKIHPGKFKDRANRVGGIFFTDPHQVEKTLIKAWEMGQELAKEPFDHAIFRAISTVAIHPFLDGNGRITRLASSSLLAQHGLMRPIIPTVFREDYILALQAYSNGDYTPVIKMYSRAMELTCSIPFESEFSDLTSWLKEKNAFRLPHKAKWGMPYIPDDSDADDNHLRAMIERG